ncbi:hypothetical protein [Vulgatibacter incomptus]|uniref:Uncharacterized protein n=1 Tax=Vulgatibacter incomptus TaxID=1391653 RepID=A0A0K1PAG7_9BACT|nr:hypothetical protein [Vulgatibacter incomptus]AKU90109.1 hypothetical protein AKJ08_0496 [Vulgatibacter incomptus]
MRATSSFGVLAAGLLICGDALAAPPGEDQGQDVSGTISSREATTEILPAPPPVGETIQIPGGWYRIESGPEEPGATGSLTVMKVPFPKPVAPAAPARAPAAPPAPAQPAAPSEAYPYSQPYAEAYPPASAYPPALEEQRCWMEKEAYARELFRIAGIWYYERPLELIQGVEETPGLALSPWIRFNLFGLATGGPLVSAVGVDPIRPVGWDEGLRWAADDLIQCIRWGYSDASYVPFDY